MIPLSKAVIRMSTYDRTNQKLIWYDEGIYLCTTGWYAANRIKEECRRRKIHYKSIFVKERSTDKRKVLSQGVISDYHVFKIGIHVASGLEKKQMPDWAITVFNHGEPVLPHDIVSYGVWIQPSRDVMSPITTSEEEYNLGLETHWV